ncbi:hypothetical protein EDC44_10932 [Cricetibacter osteomyelitidis]|uniref:Uncharacterized protein n=1 Tax=Cricetibacter osteomyelitidis TaxID=1521931 RepID=A0A4R2SZY1_9PAST|nr:hypothetical protein [Cricetibacter osteomyelitidis]TCP95340.1 hypothetical protein EDC44_10932 [Cricetibacter osteomyelitidis]
MIQLSGKYITNLGQIFNKNTDGFSDKEFIHMFIDNLDDTIDWLENGVTESKWNALYEALDIILKDCKDKRSPPEVFKAIGYLQNSLMHIGFLLHHGQMLARNYKSLVAKQNRDKQDRTDPKQQEAIAEAKRIWDRNPNLSLDKVAQHIINEEIAYKELSTVKKWIAPYNPKRKTKKETQDNAL